MHLIKCIINVHLGLPLLALLDRGKGQEVTRSMQLVVEFDGVVQFEGVLHAGSVIDSLEGIVPDIVIGDEEEPGEAIGEEHLTAFKVGGEESRGHGTGFEGIPMKTAPLDARFGEPVGTEGA